MTSERKSAANRANAQRSTGPKTANGKQNSAKNAKRHGLTRGPNLADREARDLAQLLVECDGLAPDAALNIAEALVRQSKAVRAAELLIAGALQDDPTTPWQERENAACLSVLDRLLALSDYERRATARLGKQLRKV